MHYCFGDIVVVDDFLVGIVCKVWPAYDDHAPWLYDVYVQAYSKVCTYEENEVRHLRIGPVLTGIGHQQPRGLRP